MRPKMAKSLAVIGKWLSVAARVAFALLVLFFLDRIDLRLSRLGYDIDLIRRNANDLRMNLGRIERDNLPAIEVRLDRVSDEIAGLGR